MATIEKVRADWTREQVEQDTDWIFPLADGEAAELLAIVRAGTDGRDLLDYRPGDFALDPVRTMFAPAFAEASRGRGVALVRNLPREGVSEEEFSMMTWVIGLAMGVARPQGRASQYLSPVRDTGAAYRNSTGRGYNTRSDLDFHIDGGDLVALTCYNAAKSGGRSLVVSSWQIHGIVARERPDLLEALHRPFVFNMQGEEAVGEPPVRMRPIFSQLGAELFCGWNRNRIEAAQSRPEIDRLTDHEREAMDFLDEVIQRPECLFEMDLQPGDMQILSNHVALHSRTEFEDHDEVERKRLLWRLWLQPHDAPRLSADLADFYGSADPAVLRGGIRGHAYDDRRRAFEQAWCQEHDLRLQS